MTLELLLKHLEDAIKRHLDYLEIEDVEGGSIFPHEINDDEVTYRLVIKRKKQDGAEKSKSLETPSVSNRLLVESPSSPVAKNCPRCKSTSAGCEFFDNGICRGVVYPTYPPQYDKCVF